MKTLAATLLLSGLMLSGAVDLQADSMTGIKGGEKGAKPKEHIQGGATSGNKSMRIEEPDGTLRPLSPGTLPESRMSTEGLTEIPDSGGGAMVNVEGRFQSILQVPEGSDHAIHGHAHDNLQKTKP
jgi:hypothetical protein